MKDMERRLIRAEEKMDAIFPKETPLAMFYREIIIMNQWKHARNLTVQEAIRRGDVPPGIRPASLEIMAKTEREIEARRAAANVGATSRPSVLIPSGQFVDLQAARLPHASNLQDPRS